MLKEAQTPFFKRNALLIFNEVLEQSSFNEVLEQSSFRSLTCLHTEKNDEKNRQTFGGRENNAYICSRKVKQSNILLMNINIINDIRQYFSTQPVKKAWLFGSFSRGEETSKSDVDILVEFD